jgi:uncharacterized FlaG/YvyC family protein
MSVQSTKLVAGAVGQASSFAAGLLNSPRQVTPAAIDLPKIEVKPVQNISSAFLQDAVDDANKVFKQIHSDVQFVIDSESNKVVIRLIEPSSGEVINQYPSEQVVAISNAIRESQLQATERRVTYKTSAADLLGIFVKQKS